MKINQNTEVIVDKLLIRKNVMTLGVLVRNTSGKPESVEVKLAVKFENASEQRIVPLFITDVSFDEKDNYIGYANMEYELDVVFQNNDLNDFTVVVQAYNGVDYSDVFVEDEGINRLKEEKIF